MSSEKLEIMSSEHYGRDIWRQGVFFFGDQGREATFTDVKFCGPGRLIVAHRAAGVVYLVEFDPDNLTAGYQVIHRLELRINGTLHHPDLISINGNQAFIVNYTDQCVVLDIHDHTLSVNRIWTVHQSWAFHGIKVTDTHFYFACAAPRARVLLTDRARDTSVELRVRNQIHRVKDVALWSHGSDSYLLVMGDTTPFFESRKHRIQYRRLYHLYIDLYLIHRDPTRLELVDGVEFKTTHGDALVIHNNRFYATLQKSGATQGTILSGQLSTLGDSGTITDIQETPCEMFPHGLDVSDRLLAYTSYTGNKTILLRHHGEN